MTDQAPPLIPEGHTMTKRQLLQWLENVGMDDPITVYDSNGWWLNLVGVDANPENLTVILETRNDFDVVRVQWEHPLTREEMKAQLRRRGWDDVAFSVMDDDDMRAELEL